MTLKNRVDELEKQLTMGRHDYQVQTVVVFGDGPAPDFPPGDGRPVIRIVRRVTNQKPDDVDGDFSDDVYKWQRRGWRR